MKIGNTSFAIYSRIIVAGINKFSKNVNSFFILLAFKELNSFFECCVVVQDIFAWNKNNIFMPLIETELYYGQNNSGKTLLVHLPVHR